MVILIEFEHMLEIAEVIVLGALSGRRRAARTSGPISPSGTTRPWLKHTIMTWTDKGPKIILPSDQDRQYKIEARIVPQENEHA